MDITLQPTRVARTLLALAFSFTLAHIAGRVAEITLGRTYGLFLFDADGKLTVSRFCFAVMLLLCAGLLLTIAKAGKDHHLYHSPYWSGLALIFLGLAIAEATAITERLDAPIWEALGMSRASFYVWVCGFVVALLGAYLRFLLGLPRGTQLLFVAGAAMFAAGALGIDYVIAILGNPLGVQSVGGIPLATLEGLLEMAGLEELLEMVGTAIFADALLRYISSAYGWIRVQIPEHGARHEAS